MQQIEWRQWGSQYPALLYLALNRELCKVIVGEAGHCECV
jgi:hypothetical protein